MPPQSIIALVSVLALSACGGGGGSGAVPPVTAGGGPVEPPVAPPVNATPAPVGSTPAPVSATSITGQIVATSSTGFTVQGGSGCGYVNVVTSPSTKVVTNGLSLGAGVYAKAWGSGSCATQLAASTVELASSPSGPFPDPGSPSGPGGTPTPVATATPPPVSGLSASAFTSIVNGQPWPANFRPYSQRPWNNALPDSPQNVDAGNSARLGAYLTQTETSFFASASSDDYSHPVYVASNSDPVIAFDCSAATYGCNQPFSSLHIPAAARPAAASDHHLGVIEPDGTEYDFWGAHFDGSTLTAAIGSVSSITGNGVPSTESATSGASLAAGLIRFDELARGVIPHALFVVVPCATSMQFPGSTTALPCPDGGGIPVGSHLYLTLSDAAIDALPASTVPAAEKPILHAFHRYGGIVEDTGCSGNGTETSGYPCVMFESATQYTSFGQPYPGSSWGAANGYTQNATGTWSRSGINWPALQPAMKVLSSCYDAGTCST